MPGGEWYYSDVKEAYETGLINGFEDGSFRPNENMTYAQAVKLAACMNQKYSTGSVTLANGSPNWYDSYVAYTKDQGIISKSYDWNAPATRAGYVEIFANALPDAALQAKNTVIDNAIPDVGMNHPQALAIYKLYRAGILTGSDREGTFLPDNNIKRSEVSAILTRMMNKNARKNITLNKEAVNYEVLFRGVRDKASSLRGKRFTTLLKDGDYKIDGESGNLAWCYVNNKRNLLMVDYDNVTNRLKVNSFAVESGNKVVQVSSVSINDAVEFCDVLDFIISYTTLPNGIKTIMVESRDSAYSYADGVNYSIRLIKVSENGTLELFFDDSVVGSGDEDITADIRWSFNSISGYSYTQDQFEDAFYEGSLLTHKMNHTDLGEIIFKSYGAEAIDRDDFETASSSANQYYSIMETQRGTMYWGNGKYISIAAGNYC